MISFSSHLLFASWGRALWNNADGEETGYMLLVLCLLSWRWLLLLLIHLRLPKHKEHAE